MAYPGLNGQAQTLNQCWFDVGHSQYDCINDFSSKYIITGIVKYKFLFSYVVQTQFCLII